MMKKNVDELPMTLFFNPKLKTLGQEQISVVEACLSIPGMFSITRRFNHISMNYTSIHGQDMRIEATGYIAAILQHEYDHLIGKTILECTHDFKDFMFSEESDRFMDRRNTTAKGKLLYHGPHEKSVKKIIA